MADFIELAAEGVGYVADKHFEKGYDYVSGKVNPSAKKAKSKQGSVDNYEAARAADQQVDGGSGEQSDNLRQVDSKKSRNSTSAAATSPTNADDPQFLTNTSTTKQLPPSSSSAFSPNLNRRHLNQLPSPERDRITNSTYYKTPSDYYRRTTSLERQSQTSDRVLRAYENERDDPSRRASSVLQGYQPYSSLTTSRTRNMSNANGYDGAGYASTRPRSSGRSRGRYDDDEGSDYDERTGQRYRSSGGGRGYDDDRDYDREYIETERYRGVSSSQALVVPARDSDRDRRYDSSDNVYGGGAMAPYRRSQNDVTQVSKRSRSRGRRDREYDRDRSYSRSRSRSRSGSRGGDIKEKLENLFDTSGKGIGAGIAGAVVGGLAARQFGSHKNRNRDVLLGAVIGGLGVNAAENQFRRHKEEREEQRYEGRARSSMR